LNYEPELALFASDPLLFYKRISSVSTTKLHEGGNLYMEMNEYYADEIYSAIESTGLKNIEIKEDIFGKRRMIRASHL
jgi:release factor glutamine methyltransferase